MTDRELLELLVKEVSSVKEDVSGLKEDISSVKQDVSELKEEQKEMNSDIKDLKTTTEAIKNRIEDLDSRNANTHVEIKAKLNKLIEDNKSTYEVLGGHEVAIRSLQRRPV